MTSKTVLLTGASRGIGLAIAKYLLKHEAKHRLVLVARNGEVLEKLKNQEGNEGRVEVLVGDVTDDEVGAKAVNLALSSFKSLDALILNHGTVEPIQRIADSSPSEWRSAFDTNFFSLLSFIQPALPSLRQSKGTIILVSSGAAVSAYSTWGAYGSSKAALNHLALTLAVEEPAVTSLALRPGVVDTDMQVLIRSKGDLMDKKDAEKFKGLYEGGKLVKAEDTGRVMGEIAVRLAEEGKEFSGKFLSWDSKELERFR